MTDTSRFFGGGADPVAAGMDSLVAANEGVINEIRAGMATQKANCASTSNKASATSVRKAATKPMSGGGKR